MFYHLLDHLQLQKLFHYILRFNFFLLYTSYVNCLLIPDNQARFWGGDAYVVRFFVSFLKCAIVILIILDNIDCWLNGWLWKLTYLFVSVFSSTFLIKFFFFASAEWRYYFIFSVKTLINSYGIDNNTIFCRFQVKIVFSFLFLN